MLPARAVCDVYVAERTHIAASRMPDVHATSGAPTLLTEAGRSSVDLHARLEHTIVAVGEAAHVGAELTEPSGPSQEILQPARHS